jgi:predicted nuclease with TOPRIM domain
MNLNDIFFNLKDKLKNLDLTEENIKSFEEIKILLNKNETLKKKYNGLEKILILKENFKKIEIMGNHFELFSPNFINFTSKSIENILLNK